MKPAVRALAATAILLTIVGVVHRARRGQTQRPNVVLIVSDDLGYADIGVYGSRDIPTPNIDRIAREGVRFTDAYVSGPYCSPSRAGLMTGRYPQRFGYEFNPDGSPEYGLPLTETTMAERLRTAGYRTVLLGKWHLGSADRLHPMRRGFEEFYGFLGGDHSYVTLAHTDVGTNLPDPLLDGMTPASSVTYLTDTLGDRAVAYIKQHASEPFFMYLAFNAAHVPMEAPEKYLARFPSIADPRRRTYAAMVSAMDDAIGRTLTTLRDQKLEEKTLVIFLNDNGGPTMPTTTVNGSSNAPLRGSKRQTWEGGIRVAFAMSWKGHLDAGRVEHRPVIQLDVLPTVLAAAGVTTNGAELDGVNLLPYLTGTATGAPHDALYWRLGGMMAIRRGDWKLVKTRDGPLVDVDPSALSDLSEAGLYNLVEDIGETRNRAAERPDKVKELTDLWQQWNRQLAKPSWEPRPTPSGSQGFILGPDEGDRVLNHLIKVDPARGSQRLGIGTQELKAGRGIALHIHDGEDEVLFVVSGHGVGVVGNVEREVVAGSVIYVPQGAWHGIKAIEPIHVMWIVSPPNFARFNREWLSAGGSGLADARREEIARKHKQSDSRAFLRIVLADSAWQGEEPWGRVAFRSDGLVATYRSPSGLQGALEIRDERSEDLGFIGVWQAGNKETGEFILTYDFASSAAIHLSWGERFDQHATLRRIR